MNLEKKGFAYHMNLLKKKARHVMNLLKISFDMSYESFENKVSHVV